MPRAKTILQDQFPYHVAARSRNKDWYQLPMDIVWNIYSEQLLFMTWAFGAKIHSFVLMNNHFHLLISTPRSNLNKIMEFFMRETTRSINKESKRINQAYGGPYFRCIIDNSHYYLHAYKYVYANPLKAGIINRCELYPYSSLNFLLGQSTASFPVIYDDTLYSDLEGTLAWINRPSSLEAWESVGLALKKSKFRLRRINSCRKENPLEKVRL